MLFRSSQSYPYPPNYLSRQTLEPRTPVPSIKSSQRRRHPVSPTSGSSRSKIHAQAPIPSASSASRLCVLDAFSNRNHPPPVLCRLPPVVRCSSLAPSQQEHLPTRGKELPYRSRRAALLADEVMSPRPVPPSSSHPLSHARCSLCFRHGSPRQPGPRRR